jgi:2-dehydropantoate 2-reductase
MFASMQEKNYNGKKRMGTGKGARQMNIAIIGAGAVGRLLAWFLVQGGHRPLMVGRRKEQAERFCAEGLRFVGLDGAEQVIPVEALTSGELPGAEAGQEIDGVILTVKSYDTRTAAETIREHFPGVSVLSMQNGLGNGEALAERIDPARIAIGLTTHGATADGETGVFYKGKGRTVLGDWQQDRGGEEASVAKWWCDLLAGCGHSGLSLSDDIRTEVWSKAMVNIGINPFTALHGVPNGQLLNRPDLLAEMRATVEEAERVAQAEGIALADSWERVLEVCRGTAGNRSSMLQDVERGRRTEIDALCGVIVRLGERHGIPTPHNARCLEQVLALVHS